MHLYHFTLQWYFNIVLLDFANSASCWIHFKRITADRQWDLQCQHHPGERMVPVVCVYDMALLTNSVGNRLAWPLSLTLGNILNNICRSSDNGAWIHIGLLSGTTIGTKSSDKSQYITVQSVLSTPQESSHNWFWLEMGLCESIPETMIPPLGCLGRG